MRSGSAHGLPWTEEEQGPVLPPGQPSWTDVLVIAEVVTTVRCPCCHFPLVPRITRRGPGYFCRCEPWRNHGP